MSGYSYQIRFPYTKSTTRNYIANIDLLPRLLQEDSLLIEQYEEPDTSKELYCPFELPEDEYGDMMFERRLAAEGSSVATSGPTDSRRGSIAVETDGQFSFRADYIRYTSITH